ncbi:PREDICTED: uncharacterized protein LOC105562319 [Vollenhovia emeryi]|uniref:uncharacterized protein LOC105562319 n=1 Tax=Vollenhovia emeryi TaxID=411798 RepID=UPI0005F4C554|nr:PREDICTED: uncharacterized protein LOC105562319 [Vollenhovia emeryi]
MEKIRTAISPLLTVLCLCGFGVFEYPQNQPRFYLTIFYILISWLSYAYIVFKTKLFLQRNELDYPMFNHTNMVFAILYMLFNFYYNKKFKNCLDKIDIVNNTLEKLGTPKNYVKLRIQIIWLITGWTISMFVIDLNDYLWYGKKLSKFFSIMTICIPPIGNHTFYINTLYDFMYMTLLRYVGSQFEHVNKYIEEIAEQKKQRVRYAWTTSTAPLIRQHRADIEISKQNIWILMHIHLELCSISCQLNMIFGLQMVMQAIAFHVFTVQIIYESYIIMMMLYDNFTYEKLMDCFGIYFWIIINTIKMIVLNYICERVCIKANTTEKFLNKLTNLTFDIETQETLMQFLFKILRKPLKISGFGLFYFGFKFLLECASFIAMIIVFVIQSPPRGDSSIGAEMRKNV